MKRRLPLSFTAPSNRDSDQPRLSEEEELALKKGCRDRIRFTVIYGLIVLTGLVAGLLWMRTAVPDIVPPAGLAMGPYGWISGLGARPLVSTMLMSLWLVAYNALWIWGAISGSRKVMIFAILALTLLMVFHFQGCRRSPEWFQDMSETGELGR